MTMICHSEKKLKREFGAICPKHPELNGERLESYYRSRAKADGSIVTRLRVGYCIGCQQESQKRVYERKAKRKKQPDGVTSLAILLGVGQIPHGKVAVRHRVAG